MKNLLPVIVGIAMALVPAGTAFHQNGEPLVVSFNGTGSGWASFKVSVAAATSFVTDVEANGVGFPFQMGTYLYTAADALSFGFTATLLSSGNGLYVDSTVPPGVHIDTTTSATGGFTAIGTTSTLQPGTHKVLLWVSGNAASFTLALRGAGITVLAQETGTNTFVGTAKAFSGVANAQAYQNGLGAHANVATAKNVTSTDTMILVFYNVFAGQHVLTAQTPTGTVACPCFWGAMTGPAARGPGSYQFQVTGVGGGLAGLDDIVLGGVSARLPA